MNKRRLLTCVMWTVMSLGAVVPAGSALAAELAIAPDGPKQLTSGADLHGELVLAAPGGAWDLSAYQDLVMEAKNLSDRPLTLRARLENAGAKGLADNCRGAVALLPGEAKTLRARIVRRPEDPGYAVFEPFLMYYKGINVRDSSVDPAAIERIVLTVEATAPGQSAEVKAIRAVGEGHAGPVAFFPFIDRFGQYMHSDWPGKIHTQEDFAQRRVEETQERADWPGPNDWNQYGGWASGPKLEARGHFYASKHADKWWLVDPEGRLFWSYGPTGVGFGGDVTPVTDREHWFAELPARDDVEWGRFYRERKGATYRYYKDREWVGYDVAMANLIRKYGAEYESVIPQLSHERLRSWGFNTVANWSDARVYSLRRTPYTVAIHYGSPKFHYRMPDIYHPDWEPAVRKRLEDQRGTTADDPWNIGYFIDNELWWGWRPRAAAIAEEALKSPADTPVKTKLIEQLTGKYVDITALNAAWGSTHSSWEALAEHRTPPDMKNPKVLADCGDFGMLFAERYFSVCRDAVKKVAPQTMYLGSRFHGHIDSSIVALASKYADVISYNIYDNPPNGRANQYAALDLPIMSTEWGVGSDVQQTPFRGNNNPTPDPSERTNAMVKYAEAAIRHPNIVGAHFFQYRDQPLSGRPDGEATLRGFVNIADTPAFELIQANRRVAYDLYRKRLEAK